MDKKVTLLVLICIVGILLVCALPKNADRITNAIVNETNGDVAFCYYDSSGKIDVLRVDWYSKDGEEILSETFFSDGGSHAYLFFYEDNLCINIGRTNKTHFFDREGKELSINVMPEEIRSRDSFEEWEHSIGKISYTLGQYEYVYENPRLLKDKAKLTITNNNSSVIIYESP